MTQIGTVVITLVLDPLEARLFADYLAKMRNQIGTEIVAAQQEAKIAPLTAVAAILGRLSAGLARAKKGTP